ncbi:hypothetical protein D3C79_602140 [compost metagenome]
MHLAGLVAFKGQGARQQPDSELPGQLPGPGQQGVTAHGGGQGHPRPLVNGHQVEVFGQQGQLGPLGRGPAQQGFGLGQVVVETVPGDHLQDGNAH